MLYVRIVHGARNDKKQQISAADPDQILNATKWGK